MEMSNVESSNIESIGYDAEKQLMRVKFKTKPSIKQGCLYEYANVPSEDYAAIMAAESKGKMLVALVTSRPASRPYRRLE